MAAGKVSFLGCRAVDGRKAFYLEATGFVLDAGEKREVSAGIWLAPLGEIDYGHAQDLVAALSRAWIGTASGGKPTDPLVEVFGEEPPPLGVVSDIARIVRSQQVAERLHAAGRIQDPVDGDPEHPAEFFSYSDLDLAFMAAACHPLFAYASAAITLLGEEWEGEKRENPTPVSTA